MFIIVSSSVVGISLAESLRKRVTLLDTLYCLLNEFSISIQYTAPTVWQLVECAYNNPEFESVKFLKIFQDGLSFDVPFETLWNDSVSKDFSLKSAEKDILFSLGNSLGKVGCEESISNIHLAMNRLKDIQIKSIQEYTQKGNLFRWLGFLVGIAISIIIV